MCADLPQSPKKAGKGFPWDDPVQGSCSTESSLCSAFPSTPRSTARAAAPQRSTEIQQFPFCAHKQPSYFWLPPASHPLCRVPKKPGLYPWAACFERLWELSQLGSLDTSQIHPKAVGYCWICPKVRHHLSQTLSGSP